MIWKRRPPASAAGKLLAGNAHFLDHACIFGQLITCHDAKFLRRAAAHRKSQFLQLAANVGVAKRFQNLGVQSVHNFRWRARGARIANQELKKKPGRPASETVATSGNCASRFSVVTPITLS
jgi:hypothetical protein